MHNHPEGEKQFPKKRAPRLVPIVYRVRYTGNNSDNVYDEKSGWRDKQSGPFEGIEFGKLVVFISGCLGSDSKICVDSGEDLEKALNDCEKMG